MNSIPAQELKRRGETDWAQAPPPATRLQFISLIRMISTLPVNFQGRDFLILSSYLQLA